MRRRIGRFDRKPITSEGKNGGLKEELYDIFYDYEDESGYVYRDNKEEFEGDWHELQQYIKSMRRNGCYNIDAVYREGSSGEYDEVDESLLQDIQRDYKDLNKVNDVNIAKLEDEFQRTHKDFFDRIDYHGSVMYSKRAWEAFKKWVKKEKGIEIKESCKEGLKEDIADNDIDKVYKRLSKLNKVDFGKLEDEFLKDRPNVKDAVYKFYGTILNTNRYCKDFIKWAREEKGIDLKGLPCNEGLKENKKAKKKLKEDFVGMVDWDELSYDLWSELGEDYEIYFGEPQRTNKSRWTQVSFEAVSENGTIKGTLAGYTEMIEVKIPSQDSFVESFYAKTYNVEELAKIIRKFI